MLLVADFSPLRVPTAWVMNVAAALDQPTPPVESEGGLGNDGGEGEELSQKSGSTVSASPSGPIPLVQVDAHNIVPVWEASPKLEYGARTLRGKLSSRLAEFLTPIPPLAANPPGHLDCPPVNWAAALASLQVDRSVPEIGSITPGTAAGYQAVDAFIGMVTLLTHSYYSLHLLPPYALPARWAQSSGCAGTPRSATTRTAGPSRACRPTCTSGRSRPRPRCCGSKLHVWRMAGAWTPSWRSAWCAESCRTTSASVSYLSAGFFLTKCVYKPLNFTHHHCDTDNHAHYDSLQGLYGWARDTLHTHAADPRPHLYTLQQLEAGHTHDDLWNASQLQMTREGKMQVRATVIQCRTYLPCARV
jgi:deoxyribodipyrimidine photo-lyase